jgi:hypothetical protein
MPPIPPDKDESVSATPPELRGFQERKLESAWEPVPDVRAPKKPRWKWPTQSIWANVVFAVVVVASLTVLGVYFRIFWRHDEEIRRQNELKLLAAPPPWPR